MSWCFQSWGTTYVCSDMANFVVSSCNIQRLELWIPRRRCRFQVMTSCVTCSRYYIMCTVSFHSAEKPGFEKSGCKGFSEKYLVVISVACLQTPMRLMWMHRSKPVDFTTLREAQFLSKYELHWGGIQPLPFSPLNPIKFRFDSLMYHPVYIVFVSSTCCL